MSASNLERSGLDRFWLGFLLGLFAPLTFFMLYFLFRFSELGFGYFIQLLVASKTLVLVSSMAILPNLAPFLFFVRTNKFRSGKGVMASTIVYVLSLFLLRFFLP